MKEGIKRLLRILQVEFAMLWMLVVLLVVLYEYDVLPQGVFADDAQACYVMQATGILLTVGMIPLSLRMFSLSLTRYVRRLSLPDALVSYRRWSEVRLGMLLCTSAGNDILFDESQVEQGRNFCNKIWNAYRLVRGWSVDEGARQPEAAAVAVKWFRNKLDAVLAEVEDHYSKFRISDALMSIYKLFWDDFCAWYLELAKPAYGTGIDKETYGATVGFFDSLLKMIHPFMPFITEELWQNMAPRKDGETIMLQRMPVAGEPDRKFISDFEMACEAVVAVRSIRQQKGLSPKEALVLKFKGDFPQEVLPAVTKLANISSAEKVASFSETAGVSFMVRTVEMFVPLTGLVDTAEELAKLEAALDYQEKFLASVRKKLSNERFVSSAPEQVVANERKKESDSLSKIESLKAAIASLKA